MNEDRSTASPEIKAELQLAEELIKNEIFDEALTYLYKLLEKQDNPQVHYLIGRVLYIKGQFQKSIEHLTTVVAKEPDNWKAHELLGEIYRTLGNNETAESFYQKATNINPQTSKSWKGLGKISMNRGEFQAAVIAFETYLKLSPDDAEVWILLGKCYFELGNYASATDAYNVAIDLESTNMELYELLGDVYLKMGYPDIAKRQYQRALTVEEKTRDVNLRLYHKLIRLHLEEKEYAKAFNLCTTIESLMSDTDPDTLFYAGKALVGLGNIYEGMQKVKRAYKKEQREEYIRYLSSLEDELLKRRGML
ncbi:MAG: tetratricopeptide repeat protein [Candidatus Heimdallarchaeaceae archaeon]